MRERSGGVFPVFDSWKFWDYPGMHLICANEMDEAKLSRLRQEEVHDVFDVVHSVYQKDRKNLSSNLRNVSFEVAYVAATITGTTKQFEKVLEEAHECGKERVDMGGALDGLLKEERLEGKREGLLQGERKGKQEGKREGLLQGERNGDLKARKLSSLNMLKRGFDYKTIAEINEISVDQIKAWEKENRLPS